MTGMLGSFARARRATHRQDAHHGDFGQRKRRFQPRFLHARAADADEAHLLAGDLAQRVDQLGAERVAGGLAGDQRDLQTHADHP
jgi:hypothetical protein